LIIDSHIHYGYIGYKNYGISLADLLSAMDRLGIVKAVNSSVRGLMLGDFEGEAREGEWLYGETGGRITNYLTFNPCHPEECMSVIKKRFDKKIFRGIKIHPSWHMTPGDSDKYAAIWEFASENKAVVLSHTWDVSLTNPIQHFSHPLKFEGYIKKFPDVKFIFGHSGGRYDAVVEAVRIAVENPGVYLDIAGDIYMNGFLEYAVGKAGSDRVLFGSDYSMMDQRNMLGVVLGAGISAKDRESILYGNACGLFGLEGGRS